MNILNELKIINLPKSERIVADYILDNPSIVMNMTPMQLCKVCYVSKATIYRLCDRLGLNGFADLKINISTSLELFIKENDYNYDFPVKDKDDELTIIRGIREGYHRTIDITSSLINEGELKGAVHTLKKAQVIDVYTSSANLYFAMNFKFQMQKIGVNINVFEDEYQQRLQASNSNENHVAIIISFGGRGLLTQILFEILKQKKVPIILLSSPEFNPKFDQKSFHFTINPYENHYKKISSFSTRLSILYLLDIIYTAYFELDYEKNIKFKLENYKTLATTSMAKVKILK